MSFKESGRDAEHGRKAERGRDAEHGTDAVYGRDVVHGRYAEHGRDAEYGRKAEHGRDAEYEKATEQEGWIMNFKEAYQKEMDYVFCPKAVQTAAWERMKKGCPAVRREKPDRRRILQTAAAMAAVLCMAVGVLNRSQIVSFAKSLLQSFILSAEQETMKLDSVEPVAFDRETFCADSKTEMLETEDTDGAVYRSYWRNFHTYEEMHQMTGLELPGAERIAYDKNLSVSVDFEHGYGHLSVDLAYQGMQYHVNGMFVTDAFRQEQWGYGEDDRISEVYEYADGRYAYFFENEDAEGVDAVYFVQGHMMFQLFVPETDGGWEQVKMLLEVMADH